MVGITGSYGVLYLDSRAAKIVGVDACGVEVVSSGAPCTLWLAAASLVRIDIRWDAGSAVARSG